tara:strand:- start:1331 stop:2137 length:807 start_codon:yes stop_codon:yes gene_type:complete
MKFRHNKKRNTALIYEMLVKELTKSIIADDIQKKNSISHLFKKYFNKKAPLGKENAIYSSLTESRSLDKELFLEILQNAKSQYERLNKKDIFNFQTKLINEINKSIGKDFWNNFVKDYQWSATANQVLQQASKPKDQVLLERKLVELVSSDEQKTTFPKINKATVNNFISKFNETYKSSLTENQQNILNKFILSAGDEGLELKATIYEEVEEIKTSLIETKSKAKDANLSENIDKVLDKLDSYRDKDISKQVVFEVLQMQTLAEELKK